MNRVAHAERETTAGAGPVTAYHDTTAVGGLQYRYYVKAYDLGGNRSPASNVVQATLEI